VIYEIKVFIDIMYDMTIHFYEKEIAESDMDAIDEDLHKLLTHMVLTEKVHFVVLVLSRLQT
jgi:hypothetical protein